MPDHIDELKKLELLNEARKILNTEYNKKKSDEYNNWLVKNSTAIKSTNLHLPFPPFVAGNTVPYYVTTIPYPSEHEVVAKAVSLYNERYPKPINKPVEEQNTEQPESLATEPVEEISELTSENIEPDIQAELETPEPGELAGLELRDAMIQEIYNIYGDKDIKDFAPPVQPVETTNTHSMEQALNTVPQPAEELSKIKTSNNSFTAMYQKFQSMKNNLIKPTDKGST
jgi:hypothetical protein